MRLKSYFFFTKKRFMSLIKIHILCIVISVICFVLLGFSLVFPWLYHKAYSDVDKLLPTGLDNALVLDHTMSGGIAAENNFMLDLKSSEKIQSIGASGTYYVSPEFYYEGQSIKEKILEIRRKGLDNFRTEGYPDMENMGIECVAISSATLDFYNLKLYKGSFESASNDNTVLYLGYNYKDIPIGTVLKNVDYQGNIHDQVVAGILEKNTEIIDGHACANSYAMNVNYAIELDNMVLSVQEYSDDFMINMSGPVLVSLSEGVSYEEGIEEIKRIAEKYGIIINPAPLEGKMHIMLSEFDILLDLTSSVTPVLIIITVIILISSHILTIIYRNRELGVWLSNGFGLKQVRSIILFETMIKLTGSAIVSGVLLSIYMKKQLQLVESVEHRMFFDVYIFIPLCMLFIALALSFIIFFVVNIYLSGRSIPELINISKAKTIFATLIVISFATSFVAVYYGLNFYNHFSDVKKNQACYSYREIHNYTGKGEWNPSQHILRVNDIKQGILFKEYELPVGNETNRPVRVYYILKQNENLLETVNEDDINTIIRQAVEPSCVIGDYWNKWVYEENGKNYIDILGEKTCVVATFKPITLTENDKRFYIIGDTIDKKVLDKWNSLGYDSGYLYKSSDKNDYSGVLLEIFEDYYGKDKVREMQGSVADETWNSAVKLLRNYTPIVLFILGSMVLLCFLNIGFLVFVWSRSNIYEYMIKRTFGYKTRQLLPDVLKRICSLEAIGCLIMLAVTFTFELLIHDVGVWGSNLSNGLGILIVVFVVAGAALSLIPIRWISKQEPVTVIGSKE